MSNASIRYGSEGSFASNVRSQALVWFGLIGSLLTLFSKAAELLDLAAWARWIVSHWQEWTRAFWQWIFSWFGWTVPAELSPILTFAVFALSLSFALRLRNPHERGALDDRAALRAYFGIMGSIIVGSLLGHAFTYAVRFSPGVVTILPIVMFFFLIALPFAILFFLAALESIQAIATLAILTCFSMILVYLPLGRILTSRYGENFVTPEFLQENTTDKQFYGPSFAGMTLLMLAMLWIAPARALGKRAAFLAIGTLILVGLNELSKLGIDPRVLKAPAVPG